MLVDGQPFVIGGTSVVAPLWAGLIALLNQKLGRAVGYLNPSLYALPKATQAFHDVTIRNNDADRDGMPVQDWEAPMPCVS